MLWRSEGGCPRGVHHLPHFQQDSHQCFVCTQLQSCGPQVMCNTIVGTFQARPGKGLQLGDSACGVTCSDLIDAVGKKLSPCENISISKLFTDPQTLALK